MHPDESGSRNRGVNALLSHRPASAFVLALLPSGMQELPNEPLAAQATRDDTLAGWLQAAARGDGRAFEQFYGATARHALALVRRIAGDGYAEDVLSDCYFQAWRNAAQFDASRGSALTWLLTMARSRALDRLRQETLRHGGLPGAPEFDADEHADAHPVGPDDLLESVEARHRLHAALARLAPNERWVLGLAYFRDFSQSEIASITGMPLGTVKSLMTRSQHKLREALQDGVAAPPAGARPN
ncbi:MAG TPA: sigma-70 family RNA polymerase sigma factor [Ramlibacter sp.]|uniref:RNA polymerase sigma factor n=1 Tax=Ramlibacter sp. TaxID=1917967 RepID=UPI002CB9303E|nr:sigma-70 family RNA polymerase sigma factor [Ramlibacter sp.]HVZ42979.1 sigma-70 family RNA polymerase sigma factor [Ramlibacter sp.]